MSSIRTDTGADATVCEVCTEIDAAIRAAQIPPGRTTAGTVIAQLRKCTAIPTGTAVLRNRRQVDTRLNCLNGTAAFSTRTGTKASTIAEGRCHTIVTTADLSATARISAATSTDAISAGLTGLTLDTTATAVARVAISIDAERALAHPATIGAGLASKTNTTVASAIDAGLARAAVHATPTAICGVRGEDFDFAAILRLLVAILEACIADAGPHNTQL